MLIQLDPIWWQSGVFCHYLFRPMCVILWVILCFIQLRGGQRPGAARLFAVQHDWRVLRLFCGDSGAAAHVGSWDCRRSYTNGRCPVHGGPSACCACYWPAVRVSANQRPRLRHVMCNPASYEAVHSSEVSTAQRRGNIISYLCL